MEIYPYGIPPHPTPPMLPPPRPLCGRPQHGVVWCGGGNPLWVYFHIGYRILDIYLYIYIYIYIYVERSTVTRYRVEQDRHDKTQKQTQTTCLGAAAGLNQSARANQPSKLCDHQPTADDLEHHYPGTTKQPPPTQQQSMTGTDIYEEVYRNFCHRQK